MNWIDLTSGKYIVISKEFVILWYDSCFRYLQKHVFVLLIHLKRWICVFDTFKFRNLCFWTYLKHWSYRDHKFIFLYVSKAHAISKAQINVLECIKRVFLNISIVQVQIRVFEHIKSTNLCFRTYQKHKSYQKYKFVFLNESNVQILSLAQKQMENRILTFLLQ